MKTVKVSEATGPVLDWLVARCEKVRTYVRPYEHTMTGLCILDADLVDMETDDAQELRYSRDWAQGGLILDREITKVFRNVGGTWSAMILKDVPIPPEDRGTSLALTRRAQWNGAGPTPLIAAMRCYVASKLGDEVEVPDELL